MNSKKAVAPLFAGITVILGTALLLPSVLSTGTGAPAPNTALAQLQNTTTMGNATIAGGQNNTIRLSASEVDEVYRWSMTDNGEINPTLNFVTDSDNVIQIQNPTDTEHKLIIESEGEELATSGDIEPNDSGQLTFKPTAAGTFEYHCEYHPQTMRGTVEVTNPS
jgi:plastocyanin